METYNPDLRRAQLERASDHLKAAAAIISEQFDNLDGVVGELWVWADRMDKASEV